jgi:hypothetical protein
MHVATAVLCLSLSCVLCTTPWCCNHTRLRRSLSAPTSPKVSYARAAVVYSTTSSFAKSRCPTRPTPVVFVAATPTSCSLVTSSSVSSTCIATMSLELQRYLLLHASRSQPPGLLSFHAVVTARPTLSPFIVQRFRHRATTMPFVLLLTLQLDHIIDSRAGALHVAAVNRPRHRTKVEDEIYFCHLLLHRPL